MTTQKTAHLISHTHWDREWYLPYEKHHALLIELMDTLLDTLDSNPEYRYFHLDGQTIIRDDYLQVRPEQQERLDRYIREGRIHFGPWYILQDEFLTSSEANLRNLQIGHRDAKPFGIISKTGYFPDSFGNMGQAPQILQQADIDNAIFGRGVKPTGFNNAVVDADSYESPYSEMIWRSPDGSEVLGVLFANWYCNGMEVPTDKEEAKKYWDKNLADAEKFASTPHLLFMNGCDHQPIQTDLAEGIKTANELYPDVSFVHSNFDDYIETVRKDLPDDLVTIEGELRSQHTDGWGTLVNTASSRVYLKQMNQHNQALLEKVAEPLAAYAEVAGVRPYPHAMLTYAWKTLMQNHPHDSICGCSVDEVHQEMVTRFAKSTHTAEAVIHETVSAFAGAIRTDKIAAWGEGSVPFTVFNTSGWKRSGAVSVEVKVDSLYFSETATPQQLAEQLEKKALPAYKVVDENGVELLSSIEDLGVQFGYDLPKDRFRRPYMARKVRVTVFAAIEAIGYATYALIPADAASTASQQTAVVVEDHTMSNSRISATVESNGSLTVTDKQSGTVYAGLNVFENTGDIGNEYVYRQPDHEQALTTAGLTAEVKLVEQTEYRAVFEATLNWEVPAGANDLLTRERQTMVPFTERKAQRTDKLVPMTIVTRYSLEAESGHVAVHTRFNNQATDHRLRALFPTELAADSHYADSIFEVAKRSTKPAKEWMNPSNAQHQQAFVHVTDGSKGLVVANKGLSEYEVLLDGKNTIAVTLLRSTAELGDWGVFDTPEAQCLGEQVAEYAIIPHTGDVLTSDAYAQAYQFQIPWTAIQTEQGPFAPPAKTELPVSGQLIAWNEQQSPLAFSSLKMAEETGDLVVRWFNLGAGQTDLAVEPHFAVDAVYESDVLERRKQPVAAKQAVEGYKIVTRAYALSK